MRTGIPGGSHARRPDKALKSALRGASRRGEPRGSHSILQLAVFDGHPYYVVAPPGDGEETWFDALTGAQVAGPPTGG